MSRRPSGGLEQAVLAVLATAATALTPAEVQQQLDGSLAYTTVMTALARLHEKGVVTRLRQGRAFAYRWEADQASLAARQMRRLLEREGDRSAVLAKFAAELGPEDGRLLAALLASPAENDPS